MHVPHEELTEFHIAFFEPLRAPYCIHHRSKTAFQVGLRTIGVLRIAVHRGSRGRPLDFGQARRFQIAVACIYEVLQPHMVLWIADAHGHGLRLDCPEDATLFAFEGEFGHRRGCVLILGQRHHPVYTENRRRIELRLELPINLHNDRASQQYVYHVHLRPLLEDHLLGERDRDRRFCLQRVDQGVVERLEVSYAPQRLLARSLDLVVAMLLRKLDKDSGLAGPIV
mmetsp:Transcript_36496/g.100514  ORF Transcript_36496/g.100514 Transcript_36496/m.100514 type:complete len:226 (-) Transcript_36496:1674-2351(-)